MRQERYDVSVNLKKREENKKTAYNIIEICKKNNWKKIGVVSSTSYKKVCLQKKVRFLVQCWGL